MTKKSSTPAIRFKGFTDTWEQRKLGNVANYRRGSFPQPYGKSEWYDGDGAMPFVQVADVSDEMNLVGNTKQKISMLAQPMSVFAGKNTVLVTLQGSIGRVAITQYGAFVDRTVLIFEKYKEKIDTTFWAYIVKQKFIDEARKAPGGTIKTITKEALSDFDLSIPNYKEQQQIGTFFKQLDNLITLHQRKYDKLTNVKKSMLEKMFPKNGSNVPEIRFKGFTEAWEQRELWELTIWDKKFNEVEAEKQPKIVKYPYVLADVFSKIEDASGDVRLLSTGNYIGYTTDEKAGKNLCVGEVVAIPWGGVPNIKYYKGKFVTADNRIATSNDTETLGNRFLSLYLEHSLAFLQSIYRGASIKHPSMNDVLSMQISIPHIQEQREIETWFANLDNLITLHQRELEKLKNLKKACLEKMFV